MVRVLQLDPELFVFMGFEGLRSARGLCPQVPFKQGPCVGHLIWAWLVGFEAGGWGGWGLFAVDTSSL